MKYLYLSVLFILLLAGTAGTASAIIDSIYDFEHDIAGNQPIDIVTTVIANGNVTVVNSSVIAGTKSILFNQSNGSQLLDMRLYTSENISTYKTAIFNGTLNFSFNATNTQRFDVYLLESTSNTVGVFLRVWAGNIQYHNGTGYTQLTTYTTNHSHNISISYTTANKFNFTYDGNNITTDASFQNAITKGIYAVRVNSASQMPYIYFDNFVFWDASLPAQNLIVRKFPYPYISALSISSDIDNLNTSEMYDYMDYLNTNKNIPGLGTGLNLETSQNFWMKERLAYQPTYYDYNDTVADYWTINKLSTNKDIFLNYVKSGYYDSLHSISFTCPNMSDPVQRAYLTDELSVLNANNIGIEVMINHGSTVLPCNIGVSSPLYVGDNPENSTYYHWNITGLQQPIKFYWEGDQVSSSSMNYPMRPQVMNDSSILYRFRRTIGLGSSLATPTNQNFSAQINDSNLAKLIRQNGYAIIETHFGYNQTSDDMTPVFNTDILNNLSNLNNYNKVTKEIYVTTVAKLLKYAEAQEYLNFTYDGSRINITNVSSPVRSFVPTVADLQGITFYVPNNTIVYIGNSNVTASMIPNGADETGAVSIMFHLTTLTYPEGTAETYIPPTAASCTDSCWNKLVYSWNQMNIWNTNKGWNQ